MGKLVFNRSDVESRLTWKAVLLYASLPPGKTFTNADLSQAFNAPSHRASSLTNLMFESGELVRAIITGPTGGKLHVYKLPNGS